MANIEKLTIWQKAIDLSTDIYRLTTKNTNIKNDYWLKDQLQRSSVSIASNIAEWGDRSSQKEFARFLFIARGSCSELKTQLVIIKRLDYLSDQEFDSLHEKIIILHKMINGMIQKVVKNV
jgi:four helix bundle protein